MDSQRTDENHADQISLSAITEVEESDMVPGMVSDKCERRVHREPNHLDPVMIHAKPDGMEAGSEYHENASQIKPASESGYVQVQTCSQYTIVHPLRKLCRLYSRQYAEMEQSNLGEVPERRVNGSSVPQERLLDGRGIRNKQS